MSGRFGVLVLSFLLGAPGWSAEPTGFGAMASSPRQPEAAVRVTKWAQAGGWEWVRLTSPPVQSLEVGLCRVIWPGAQPEPAAFSPEIRAMRLGTDPWEIAAAVPSLLLLQDTPTAYEIGNEPDLYFTPDLPDRMALTLKAAWWAIKTQQPDAPVLMPSLAARPGPYARLLAANNLANYTDAWNVHLYGWAHDFGPSLAEHRRFLEKVTGARRPVWVTEIGFAEFPEVPPPAPEFLLARQRAFFERVTVAAPFAGLAQQWAFILGPRLIQGLDYGLNEPDGTARPALEALVRLTRELPAWRPAFELKRRADGAVVGQVLARRALERGEEATWLVLLMSPHRRADFALPEIPGLSARDQPRAAPETSWFEFHLRFPPGYGPVRWGIDGAEGVIAGETLKFTASAATNLFLRTPARRFEVEDCDWIPVRAPERRRRPDRPRPSPVVISFAFPTHSVRPDKEAVAYRYPDQESLRLVVRGDNFGAEPMNGTWRLQLPPGWRTTGKRRGWMQVPAGGSARQEVVLSPPTGVASSARQLLTVEWVGDPGYNDRAAVWLASEPDSSAFTEIQPWPADWQPTEAETRWERADLPGEVIRFRLMELRPGATTGLILPLPAGLRLHANDVLRISVRAADEASSFRRRLDLITPGRHVFRHGDDWVVDTEWQTLELRVGDFTPAFWSRADPTARTGPAEARYLRLGLFGLTPGGTIELGPVTISSSPKRRMQDR